MRILVLTLLSLMFVCGSLAQTRGEILYELRRPGKLLIQTRIAPAASFNPATMKSLLARILHGESEKVTFPVVKIEVFPDREAAIGCAKGVVSIVYGYWRDRYDSYATRIPPSAQLVCIGGNSVVKLRDEFGTIHSEVIAGSDPTAVVIGDFRFFLANISCRPDTRSGNIHNDLEVSFFFWTSDAYDESSVERLLGECMALTPMSHAFVVVEQSPWFIYESDAAILYPFWAGAATPPSEKESLHAYRVTCGGRVGEPPNCWSYGQKR